MKTNDDLSLCFMPFPNRCVIFVPLSDTLYRAYDNAADCGFRVFARRPGLPQARKFIRERDAARAKCERETSN